MMLDEKKIKQMLNKNLISHTPVVKEKCLMRSTISKLVKHGGYLLC